MIAAFAFAFVMSFWGSVPPGPCNITVLHTTLNYNSKAGIWVAFGSSVPELLYSFIALVAVHFVSAFVAIGFWLELSTAIILFVIGIYTVFFQKKARITFSPLNILKKNFTHVITILIDRSIEDFCLLYTYNVIKILVLV